MNDARKTSKELELASKNARQTIKELVLPSDSDDKVLLKFEDKDTKVEALQTLLYDVGLAHIERDEFVTGVYDDATRAAVKLLNRGDGKGKRFKRKLAEELVASHAAAEKAAAAKSAAAEKAARDKIAALEAAAEEAEKDKTAALEAAAEEAEKAETAQRAATDKIAALEAARRRAEEKLAAAQKPAASPGEGDYYVNTGVEDDKPGVTARLLNVDPVGQELEYWCWAASTQMMVGYLRSLEEVACPTCGRRGHHGEEITQGQQMNRRLGDSEVDCRGKKGPGFDYKTCDRGGWPYFFEYEESVESTKWAARRHVLEEHGLVLRDGGPRLRVRRPLSDWELRALTYGSGPEFKRRLDNTEGCALSWEMLTGLLDAQRPVAFTYRWPHPGSGHMRLAVGYAVTPGNRRWVAVVDPLPPGTGEIHLIPYEYYVDGPCGGHWRDYWVAPADKSSPARLRRRSHELRVGKELVASYITYPEDTLPKKPSTDGQRLDEKDRAAAFREAEAGLAAVKAIASAAKPMAVHLGMGGAFARAFGQMLGGEQEIEVDFEDVEADSLELDEKDYIPVYELRKKELEDWVPGDPPDLCRLSQLLDRPREIIYEIIRPKQVPLSFFATVTVRRKGDGWKLASLGKTYLMGLFQVRQFADSMAAVFGGRAPSAERLTRFFLVQGLLEGEPDEELTDEKIEESLKEAREADRTSREDRRKRRDEEIAELKKTLESESDPTVYPQKLWKSRDAEGPDPDEDVRKGWKPWVEWWAGFWTMLRDKDRREECKKLLQARPSPGGVPIDHLFDRISGSYQSPDRLLDLVDREEEIESLCAEWSSANLDDGEKSKLLGRLFDAIRAQEIEWLRRRFSRKTYRERILPFSKAREPDKAKAAEAFDREPLLDLRWLQAGWFFADEARRKVLEGAGLGELSWNKLDRSQRQSVLGQLGVSEKAAILAREEQGLDWLVISKLQDEEVDGSFRLSKPKYIIDVPELYQLLIAYSAPGEERGQRAELRLEDRLEPVYPKSFHRPEKRVEAGSLLEVLKDLQDVAKGIAVRRGG